MTELKFLNATDIGKTLRIQSGELCITGVLHSFEVRQESRLSNDMFLASGLLMKIKIGEQKLWFQGLLGEETFIEVKKEDI